MVAYIKGSALISPQQTFAQHGFPEDLTQPYGKYLKCIEPVYRDFIDPMVARRMSRIVKMGVCGALKCLQVSGIRIPDAIIAGTGLGCLEDTEKFLASIYNSEEKLLNPTPFIQSTHNTVAGAIALALKCHGYNATYTHRGFSFESALEDSLMQLNNNPALYILTGGFDELTESAYIITQRLGLWKNGCIPGEGVAFFMLGGVKEKNDAVCLRAIKTFYKPDGFDAINSQVNGFLTENHKLPGDIDLVILGNCGSSNTNTVYDQLVDRTFHDTAFTGYKHLCGEYDTSSSFAMWLASQMIKEQYIPVYLHANKNPDHLNNILIYNHLRGTDHSLYLLERC
jgi:3-oxoacyl-[acyl-carrier-protein] synthase II